MRPHATRHALTTRPAAISAVLCFALATLPEPLAEAHTTAAWAQAPKALTPEQRAEHVLNRFTFGPRPGEAAGLPRRKLDKWMEAQLHPETVDDSAFEQRLAAFPALKLSQADLIRRLPSSQSFKAEERRGWSEPTDPVQRAINADAAAAYAARRDNKADNGPKSQEGAPAMAGEGASTRQLLRKEGREERAAGTTEAEVNALLALAPEARLQTLVAMTPEQMLSFRAALREGERLRLLQGLSPQQAESVAAMTGVPERVLGAEILQARLLRSLYSERQLQAVMVDFWLNHFNVYASKNQNEPYFLPAFEREAILPHALGHFEDLLVATAQSPAMLMYLDNWQSIGPNSQAANRIDKARTKAPNATGAKKVPQGINENYARELMELHTLGVNGGYTQRDVVEVAKCLTGWTIDRPNQGGAFRFEPNRHEPGSKAVLGKTIAEGGEGEGRAVLHILATSPATAHFISQKLAVRFVSDTPPPSLVDAMAKTFLKKNGDIAEVLRTLFKSKEFWAPAVYKAKVKTPLEFVTSAVRASGAHVDNDQALVGALHRLGMPLYGMQTPNGYSWKADEWVNSNALVARLNLALVFSTNRLPGTRTDWTTLLQNEGKQAVASAGAVSPPQGDATALASLEPKLETLLLGQPAGTGTHTAVLDRVVGPADGNGGTAATASTADLAAAVNLRDVVGPARPVRSSASKSGAGQVLAQKRQASRAGGAPASPLETMAGLLLGSPEFQRR